MLVTLHNRHQGQTDGAGQDLRRRLGGSAQQVSREVAEAAVQAGNGIQLGLDVAWDVFLAIGTAMLA